MNIIFERAEIAAARTMLLSATRDIAAALGLDAPEQDEEFDLVAYATKFDPKYVRVIDADNVIEIWISPEATTQLVGACGAYYADVAEFIKALMPLIKFGRALIERAVERFESVASLVAAKHGGSAN